MEGNNFCEVAPGIILVNSLQFAFLWFHLIFSFDTPVWQQGPPFTDEEMEAEIEGRCRLWGGA